MSTEYLKFAAKNVFWGYAGAILSIVSSLISRTVFIRILGVEFLGINGLCQSVLGILSLSELGMGSAMLFSLFKPVAHNDHEKIKALMVMYRKVYRIVALTVFLSGVMLLPFLHNIARGAENIPHIYLYYCIFLFNSVSSYFVSYAYNLLAADQKNYLLTNINTCVHLMMSGAQIFCLCVFRSFIVYLLVITVFQTAQKIYTWFYINKHYPFLKEKSVTALPQADKVQLITNIKAVIWHKLADVCVWQSSSIIISSFVNIATVGLYSNYIMFSTFLNNFINTFFSGLTGSIGNLFAQSDSEKNYKIFKVNDFVAFWLYNVSSVAFFVLIQPFIVLAWGEKYKLSTDFLILFTMNYYIFGLRASVHRLKTIGGIFDQDKYIAVLHAVCHLLLSLVFVKYWGLVGMISGSLLAGLLPALGKPYIVFKHLFGLSPFIYYKNYICQFIVTIFSAELCLLLVKWITRDMNWITFFISIFAVVICANLLLVLIFFRNENFIILKKLLFDFVRNKQLSNNNL